jgi:hypothetical protein
LSNDIALSNIHTGDNVTIGDVSLLGDIEENCFVGHVIGMYVKVNQSPMHASMSKGCAKACPSPSSLHTTSPRVTTVVADHHSDIDLDETKVMVVRYEFAEKEENDNHPLIRCTREARFSQIPRLHGYQTPFFKVLHLTPNVEVWPLSHISGQAMVVPEIIHLPVTGIERSGPTSCIFDISAIVKAQQCKQRRG